VAPFLILLSLTGIVYLFKPQLDNLMYPELMKVAPASQTLSADQLLAKAMMTMPDASLRKYLPPVAPDQSAQFIVNQGDRELTLF
ncbi:PepSY domain-containing protein, partial [Escherichia coli]|nr:PepSY domain-containing protein [Escherichia coli]